jgi:pSer/pThr/pTyr-binding forkhead associated (FHA) protein
MEARTNGHQPGAIEARLRIGRHLETNVAMTIKLLVVQGKPQGKCLQFRVGRDYMFGRGAECHIRPNSDWVSRQHCMLSVTTDGTLIRDLGSRNGTLVNGVRLVGEQRLNQGDQLQVGPIVFEVDLNGTDDGAPSRVPKTPRPPSVDETGVLRVDDTAESPFMDQVRSSDVEVTSASPSDPSLLVPPAS